MQATTPISRIMTRKPEVVKPSDTMEEVRQIFEKRGFHHIPVVSDSKLVGLVSYTDYLSLIRDVFDNPQDERTNEKVLHALKVEEVMTKHLLCLNHMDTVETALRIFKANQFHSLPVVDDRQHLVGIITTYDLMKVLEKVFMEYADAVEDPGV
ncbi:MAG: CBS domain-containing protein [Saprospiraceae bacterium]|nr:CBS domain-containing protein [Saprospiraceae bacterium]